MTYAWQQNQVGMFATPVVPTSPNPSGPGGNTIVPTPATPSDWPKMILAIAVISGGLWFLSTFNEQYATYAAIVVVLAMVTYYETHGNKRFSTGLKDLASVIPGW